MRRALPPHEARRTDGRRAFAENAVETAHTTPELPTDGQDTRGLQQMVVPCDIGYRSGTLVADMDTGRVGVLLVGGDYSLTVKTDAETWVPSPDRLRLANDEERAALRLAPLERP